MIWSLLLIPAWAILNHLRGGGGLFGLDTDKLPGITDMWCAPVVALVGYLIGVHTWLADFLPAGTAHIKYLLPVGFAACWLCWSTPAWGFLQGLGNGPGPIATRQPSWYEKLFLQTGNVYFAYGLRTTLFLIPTAVVFGIQWLAIGPLQVLAYTVAWKIRPKTMSGIPIGELLTGACWGAFAALYTYI